ncbi:MAG: GntR family transcriptional regulator [Bacteroidales bacterium]|nr:GntR family transcriptional regulator [Bacteroidales bacterium]
MEFDSNRPIYLQIVDAFCDRVLAGELAAGGRIPSVREYGASIGVNPNTVARSYEKLTDLGVIYNQRGIGFFVAEDALKTIQAASRKQFLEDELPRFAERARLLGISKEEIISAMD